MSHNIVAIDGINGEYVRECTKFVESIFNKQEIEVTTFRFPNYDTPTGKLIRRYLDEEIELEPFVAHTIFALNRFEQKDKILQSSSTDEDQVAIIDRYWNSGYCYAQASGLTDFEMSTLQNIDMNLPFPNCMLIIDSEPNPKKKNRLEKDLKFLRKVRANFKSSARVYDWNTIERFEYKIPGQVNLKKILKTHFPTLLNSLE